MVQTVKPPHSYNDFFFKRTKSGIIDIDFHMHIGYELIYLISGNVNYFVENKVYELKPGDLVMTNSHEVHTPSFLSDRTYERIVIEFGPELPGLLSDENFDLLSCFNDRNKGERNKFNLTHGQREEILEIFNKLEPISNENKGFKKIQKITYLIELLVILNTAFLTNTIEDEYHKISHKTASIIEYICDNLQSDLSLEFLEKKFFINKSHLSRVFKKETGVKLHEYIVHKRIAKAKELLQHDFNITDICFMTGFNDYSNFLKTFKKIVGESTSQFKRRRM